MKPRYALTLFATSRGGEQTTHHVVGDRFTIGRVRGNDVVLPKSNVSKRHVYLTIQDGQVFARDSGSTNGTYMDGRKLSLNHPFKPGDCLYVGGFVISYREPPRALDADEEPPWVVPSSGSNTPTSASADPRDFEFPDVPDGVRVVTLDHARDGRLRRDLLDALVGCALGLDRRADARASTSLDWDGRRLCVRTDMHRCDPLVFPGGALGSLAVFASANRIAASGAVPRYASLTLLLEDGVDVQSIRRQVRGVRIALNDCGMRAIGCEVQVLPRGSVAGMHILVTAMGGAPIGRRFHADQLVHGDAILCFGQVGHHGAALLAARESRSVIWSDARFVGHVVPDLLDQGIDVRWASTASDGLRSALERASITSRHHILIDRDSVPSASDVVHVTQVRGLDVIDMANAGLLVAAVPGSAIRNLDLPSLVRTGDMPAACIGSVQDVSDPGVTFV